MKVLLVKTKGFALMEVRDELRRLYKNSDSIDWFLTEYLKY